MARKRISAAIGLAVTAVFLYMASRNVEADKLKEVLAGAELIWLLPILGIAAVDILIRALRWRILLSGAVKAPLWTLYQLEAIGLGVNNVLFARLGEITRAVLAGKRLGIPLMTSLASVAVERALDVAALLTLFTFASAGSPLVAVEARAAAGLLLGAAVAALTLLAAAGDLMVRLTPFAKPRELVSQLVLGAAVLRRPGPALAAAALSLALWLIDAGLYWCAARALGLGGLMDFSESILVLSWAGAGAALPAAPGAIGTFEAMVKDILMKLGADAHAAFGYALFVHMTTYLFVTGLGLLFLYRLGLTLSSVKREKA